jgi:hypothetical protein
MDLSPYGPARGMLYLITKALVVAISSAVFKRALIISIVNTVIKFSNAFILKQIIIDYDRVALKTGLTGSMIMASVVFCFNVSVFYHYYYYPFSLLLGLLSYLFFLRRTRGVQPKDIEIPTKILTGRAAWLTSVIASSYKIT